MESLYRVGWTTATVPLPPRMSDIHANNPSAKTSPAAFQHLALMHVPTVDIDHHPRYDHTGSSYFTVHIFLMLLAVQVKRVFLSDGLDLEMQSYQREDKAFQILQQTEQAPGE